MRPKKPMNPKRRSQPGRNPSAPRKPSAPSPATLRANADPKQPLPAMACCCILPANTPYSRKTRYMTASAKNATAFAPGKRYLLFVWGGRDARSLCFHGDSSGLGFRALGPLDGQDAILQPGLHLAGIHSDGQWDGSLEAAEAAL